jgi:DNA-binding NtrC family response regulator
MNFIWLTSAPGDAARSLPEFKRILISDIDNDPLRVIQQSAGNTTAIIEIKETDGADSPEDERAFELLSQINGSMPVWIYRENATVPLTVAFVKAGASHVAANLAELKQAMARESSSSPVPEAQSAGTACDTASLVGTSRSTRNVAASIALVSGSRCNVLIEGETGTGKEVVAREIHTSGNRRRGPWIAVNCGAIPDTLLEAELFGYAKGAFTGAVQARTGKFEAANHGTIFLDEIGDMPMAIQAKLLRVLQEREIERLGGNERVRLDIRVIAATNANLSERVRDGLFRQDLFYRLNVFRIALDPLRERPSDIAVLAQHFVLKICASERLRPKALDSSVLDRLMVHDWPGNARELENVMETAILVSGSRATLYASDIRFEKSARPPAEADRRASVQVSGTPLPAEGLDYQQALHAFERDLLAQAIARTRGNKSAAADLLRLKRTTLSARMRVLESRQPRLVA